MYVGSLRIICRSSRASIASEALIKSRDASLFTLGSPSSSSSIPPSLAATQNAQEAEHERPTAGRGACLHKALAVLDDMLTEERRLLALRDAASAITYLRARIALAAVYAIVVIVLFVYLRGLVLELRNRERAEESVLQLSGRLLQLQDAERRKIARDLHDSFCQTFAALKMNLDQIATANRSGSDRANELLADCEQLVEKCMIEARTLSHLLHPPLLDELGFPSAAKSLYRRIFRSLPRSGVNLDLPEDPRQNAGRNRADAVSLRSAGKPYRYRITAIQASPSVDIRPERRADGVNLTIRDYGKGIPADLELKSFANSTGAVGVGLDACCASAIRQLKGQMESPRYASRNVSDGGAPIEWRQRTGSDAPGSARASSENADRSTNSRLPIRSCAVEVPH